jgi:hypothetical protein
MILTEDRPHSRTSVTTLAQHTAMAGMSVVLALLRALQFLRLSARAG